MEASFVSSRSGRTCPRWPHHASCLSQILYTNNTLATFRPRANVIRDDGMLRIRRTTAGDVGSPELQLRLRSTVVWRSSQGCHTACADATRKRGRVVPDEGSLARCRYILGVVCITGFDLSKIAPIYSTHVSSKFLCISFKTKDWCTYYSTHKRGGAPSIFADLLRN
jgi:hypothetical protein